MEEGIQEEIVDQGTPEVTQEVSNGSEETTESQNTEESTVELGGDKDWGNKDNYSTDPAEFLAQRDAQIKAMNQTHNQKLREMQEGKPKFAANSIEELKELITTNPEFQNSLREEQQTALQAKTAAENASQNIDWAANNWSKMPETQQQNFWHSLKPEQQTLFKNTLTLQTQQREIAQANFQKLENGNTEKYGDLYKESSPKLVEYFQNSYKENPREVVFKAMDYVENGKRQFELGKKEALKELSGASGITPGGVNSGPQALPSSPQAAMDAALAKHGIKGDNPLAGLL